MSNITGQIIVRDAGRKDGKRIVMVTGIIAVPDDFLENHHQYTVAGEADGHIGRVAIMGHGGIDRNEEAQGNSMENLLLLPIWRV